MILDRKFLRPLTLTAGNFAALWPTDPKFSALKDLNLFETVTKLQVVISMLEMVFSLSKWGHFDRAKPTLKLLLASWTFYSFLKGFRSFNAENLGSVGQRAAKWPAFKLWEWLDRDRNRTRADWPTGAGAGWQTFSWDLQLWQLVTLQPFDLQTPNFQHLNI